LWFFSYFLLIYFLFLATLEKEIQRVPSRMLQRNVLATLEKEIQRVPSRMLQCNVLATLEKEIQRIWKYLFIICSLFLILNGCSPLDSFSLHSIVFKPYSNFKCILLYQGKRTTWGNAVNFDINPCFIRDFFCLLSPKGAIAPQHDTKKWYTKYTRQKRKLCAYYKILLCSIHHDLHNWSR